MPSLGGSTQRILDSVVFIGCRVGRATPASAGPPLLYPYFLFVTGLRLLGELVPTCVFADAGTIVAGAAGHLRGCEPGDQQHEPPADRHQDRRRKTGPSGKGFAIF